MAKSRQNQPFFSVIIPALNEERYLSILLRCLSNQDYRNFEAIVVNGLSHDQTKKVSMRFRKKLPHFRYVEADRNNVPWQRNLGASFARGKYLVFIDADVRFHNSLLAKLHDYAVNGRYDLFCTKFSLDRNSCIYQLLTTIGNLFVDLIGRRWGFMYGFGAFMVVKTKVFHKLHGYNPALLYAEDQDLIRRSIKLGYDYTIDHQDRVVLSARRYGQNGFMKTMVKYLYLALYEKWKGPITGRLPVDYPMGGEPIAT